MRMIGRGGAYVPTGDAAATGSEGFIGNVLTSDPVRYARNAAVLEEEPELGLGAPTVAWADAAMRQMKAFAGRLVRRQDPPADLDGGCRPRRSRLHAGNRSVRTAICSPGRHLILAGAKHEILQEQDQYRGQFWAAFDAFVPGTPRF